MRFAVLRRHWVPALACLWLGLLMPASRAEWSVAREWNEENLAAIRISFPDPPVHARNLFHVSVAMWDAWAAFDPLAVGYLHNEEVDPGEALEAARHETLSYAAYRVLTQRYVTRPHPKTPLANSQLTNAALRARMALHGYPVDFTSIEGDTPAALGNRIAEVVLDYTLYDGANERFGYLDFGYTPVNEPLILAESGTDMVDPNRWQPLAFDVRVTQNGIEADKIQTFVGSHWGNVRPFALHHGPDGGVYHDPGLPPQLGGVGDAAYKANSLDIVRKSGQLDPDRGVMIDISPGAIGGNPLGTNDGEGHEQNPATGQPYAPNVVNLADYGRVIAEYWADGPQSETPPGHWNSLANKTADGPGFAFRIGGEGEEVDRLEWDVKTYFTLNGAVHDVAVATWGCKRDYDYVRPISSIRYLGQNGQLPVEEGLCELITAENTAPGGKFEAFAAHVGENAVRAWAGEPADPETQVGGSAWILAADWLPYQRSTFVTPAFAGYTSGHSGFSRAAAEVLANLTGSPFFPGGLGSHHVAAGELEFEYGPSAPITLQWGTYYDAADEAGMSRLFGGIHVAPDDGPGRRVGSRCGIDAWNLARQYFDGRIVTDKEPAWVRVLPGGEVELSWYQTRGMFYALQSTDGETAFTNFSLPQRAEADFNRWVIPASEVQANRRGLFRIERSTQAP